MWRVPVHCVSAGPWLTSPMDPEFEVWSDEVLPLALVGPQLGEVVQSLFEAACAAASHARSAREGMRLRSLHGTDILMASYAACRACAAAQVVSPGLHDVPQPHVMEEQHAAACIRGGGRTKCWANTLCKQAAKQ